MGTTIHNSDLFKEMKAGARIQQMVDVIPNQLAEKVIAVMEVNPKLLRIANVHKAVAVINSTSGIVFTTPTDKDFYITNISVSFIKDATATSTMTAVTATIGGTSNYLIYLPSLTLTAQNQTITISFDKPLKVDRDTNISLTNTTNVANITATATLQGYFDDVTLA